MENKRASNFTESEINYLVNLVNKKKDIIECKKTDKTTAVDKNPCWIKIQDNFNAQFTTFRSYKTLKNKYDNMKKSAKKNYALDKKEIYKTGGGTKSQTKTTAMDDEIIQMLQMEQVEGLPSIYDDDQIENVLPTIDLDEADTDRRRDIRNMSI